MSPRASAAVLSISRPERLPDMEGRCALPPWLRSSVAWKYQWTFGSPPGPRVASRRPIGARPRFLVAAGRAKRRHRPTSSGLGAYSRSLASDLKSRRDDLLVVSVLSQANYSRASNARLWLDFSDAGSLFATREAEHRSGIARRTTMLQARWLQLLERRYAGRAALITAAGWEDNRYLRSIGVDSHWLPTPLPDHEFKPVARLPESTFVAGFLGNFESCRIGKH